MATDQLDMLNRDPVDINNHLRVEFEDVIAEPDGAHSCNCIWSCSRSCFKCGLNCCYTFLTAVCGCCMALCWGCEFAIITFVHIWQFTPCLRCFAINCGCCQKFWGTTLQCFLAPICETCGLFFSRINVNNYKS